MNFLESLKNNQSGSQQLTSPRSHRWAFTLAETLITLGIIGVVAAICIPALLNNIQETQYKKAYKKAYSSISQAFLAASNNSDIVPMTGSYNSQGMEANFEAIKNQFKVVKECTNSQTQGCWNTSGELWRTEDYAVPGFIDNTGMAWKLRAPDTMNIVPAILLDTNGFKKPNQYGKDRFPLTFSSASTSDIWYWLQINTLGVPTHISPFADIPQNTPGETHQQMCPSYAKMDCYYTSWLFD